MRVFIAHAVGMSTFFVAAAIGFPRQHTRTAMSKASQEKTNRFPLLGMAPRPRPTYHWLTCDGTDESRDIPACNVIFISCPSVIPSPFHSTKNSVKVRAPCVHPGGRNEQVS